MTALTIKLSDELAARLAADAQARGIPTESAAAEALSTAYAISQNPPTASQPTGRNRRRLRPETEALLQAEASRRGQDADQLADALLTGILVALTPQESETDEDEEESDEDLIASLREGVSDMKAGRLLTMEEARAEFEAAFAIARANSTNKKRG